ncbi:uncharacterized protein [Eurosta solidaginis]|uniref:uncharacterized protein n=1 Tax=Eurosta solidaginis TaxID=178769 RepID=UPI003531516D
MWLILLFGLFISTTNCDLSIPLCPSGGQPVCAKSDYELIYFENECKLNVYSYQRLFAGQSRPTRIALEECFSNCAGIICPAIYKPVCAQQIPEGPASTLPNACLVNQLICVTKKRKSLQIVCITRLLLYLKIVSRLTEWIITSNAPCVSTSESSESYHGAYAVPPPSSEPTSYNGSKSESAHSVHSKQVPSTNGHAPNTARYTQTLLASATSSDKYTLAAYSSLLPEKKESEPKSAPATSYQLSSSKTHHLTYASSSQGLPPVEKLSYHTSLPISLTDSSHVSYAFDPTQHGSADAAPTHPIYATPTESPLPYVPTHLYKVPVSQSSTYAPSNDNPQQSPNVYHAPSSQSQQSTYVASAHITPAVVPPASSYPSSDQASVSYATTASPSPDTLPVYVAPEISETAPTSYPHPSSQISSSAGNSYNAENIHPALSSLHYHGQQQTTPSHYENAQTSNYVPSSNGVHHANNPQTGSYSNTYQGRADSASGYNENSQTTNQDKAASYHAANSQSGPYSNDYKTAAPSESTHYDSSRHLSEENSHYGNSHISTQVSPTPSSFYQIDTPEPAPYSNEGAVQPTPTHYENSLPLPNVSSPSTNSYQAGIPHSSDYQEAEIAEPFDYQNSQISNQYSAAGIESYTEKNTHSGQSSYETKYQTPVQPEPAHNENSQPTNQEKSYPSNVSLSYELPETVYPTLSSDDLRGAFLPNETHYAISKPSHYASSTPSEFYQTNSSHPLQNPNNYQGVVPSEPGHYGNLQTSRQPLQSTASSYQVVETPYSKPVEKEYQETVHPAPAKYENLSQPNEGNYNLQNPNSNDYQEKAAEITQAHYGNSVPDPVVNAYPTAEEVSAPSACLEEGSVQSYHVPHKAPEHLPTISVATQSNTEGHNISPVNYSRVDTNATVYANPISEDSYLNAAPVASDPVSYTPKETASKSKDTSRQETYTAPEVASDYVSPSQEIIQPTDAYPSTNQYIAPNSTQARISSPSEEIYSKGNSYPTLVKDSISYAKSAQSQQSSDTSPALYPHQPKQSAHQKTSISSLNIYLAPAPAHAKSPTLNVYTIPYRYPLSASGPSQISEEIPYPQAPSNSIKAELQIPIQEISEAYDPKLAEIVGKWIDSKDDIQHLLLNDDNSLGVPFYYQPSITLIQYNDHKSQHSKK